MFLLIPSSRSGLLASMLRPPPLELPLPRSMSLSPLSSQGMLATLLHLCSPPPLCVIRDSFLPFYQLYDTKTNSSVARHQRREFPPPLCSTTSPPTPDRGVSSLDSIELLLLFPHTKPRRLLCRESLVFFLRAECQEPFAVLSALASHESCSTLPLLDTIAASFSYVVLLSFSHCSIPRLEVSWFERDSESTFVNLSSLSALLNSSCLHRLSCLSDIHKQINSTNICRVHLSSIELHRICSVLSHAVCGHPVLETCDRKVQCSFCHFGCENELIRCFHLEMFVADETSSVFTWSTGQTASELLQISPDEFYELPEDEQAMYLYTMENERFTVAIVHSGQKQSRNYISSSNEDCPIWEITRAQKCD